MSRLTWSNVGERFYETGVDRGVLYIENQPGVVWNGLTSINETTSGGEQRPRYIDGVKYYENSAAEELGLTINAFTYPDEFGQCDGTAVMFSGVFITQQKRRTFGLTYRTRVGNDSDGSEHAYKIHLVYGVRAAPSERSYETLDQDSEPLSFSWTCTTKPVVVGNDLKPTAHIVIDSRKITPQALAIVEDRLYGTDEIQSYLPSPEELFLLFTTNPGLVYRLLFNSVTGLSTLLPETPGDLSETITEGMLVLTETSHLSDGSTDGLYSWVE